MDESASRRAEQPAGPAPPRPAASVWLARGRRLLALSSFRRRLLARAVVRLVVTRVVVAVVPFGRWYPRVQRRIRAPAVDASVPHVELDQVLWAVHAAARHVPIGATCLVHAVAGSLLLARHGHPSQIRIGVARGTEGGLEAHAWVECGERVVIGATGDLDRFVAFPVDGARSLPMAFSRAGDSRSGPDRAARDR
ncbi:MAG: lasso peptide biosynthesis B2 protein [Ectothiorhodospiraceae bacterium]|nr:lasso peptide biosynthesis B2 protein [Chromatiales bacterium]MCP5153885.1 lasso peptide biosynthesis B2 protein [Ectothiorhodospiraceae bacterium]